jgi:hypothetical protein
VGDVLSMHAAPSGAPAFRKVALAYALGQVADWFAEVTLALVVFRRTGSPLAAALVFVALRVLPVAGMRWAAGRSLTRLAALRTLAMLALALGVGVLPVWALLALGIVDGLGSLGGRAGSRAAAVRLLGHGGALRSGNALLNFAFSFAAMAAPVAAGMLVSGLGATAALGAASAALAAGACVASRVRIALPPRPRAGATGVRRALRESGSGRWLAAEIVLLVLFTAAVPVELPYVIDSLGAGAGGYGALLTAWGAGMVAGSVVFAALRRIDLPLLAAGSTLAVALAYLAMGVSPSLVLAAAAALLGGVGNGVQWVSAVSWIQQRVPRALAPQLSALLESVAALAPGAGFLAGGAAVTLFDPRACLVAGAAFIVAVTAWAVAAALWPGRRPGSRLRRRLEPVRQPFSYVEPTPLGREPYSG